MKLQLKEIIIHTRVARAGMSVREVFEECVAKNVPGIPFVNDDGDVVGRISVRHTLKNSCIPDFMVTGAHLLGDTLKNVQFPEGLAHQLLRLPCEQFLLEPIGEVNSRSPVVKALSVMEQKNSGYIFIIDEGRYIGIVKRMGIAALMLECEGA